MSERTIKRCTRCGETKSIDQFHCQRSSRDGKQCYCKPCATQLAVQWHRDNASYIAWRKSMGIKSREGIVPCDDMCP
jgi:hypothetical protein